MPIDEVKVKRRNNRKKKPRYYLRQSWNYDDWWAICQKKNNVMVCECTDKSIAELILEYLNALQNSVTRHVKVN